MIEIMRLGFAFLTICLAGSMAAPTGNSNTNEALDVVIGGVNQFSMNFLKTLAKEHTDNLITSPFGAYLALSMVAYGARGSTGKQCRDVLHLPDNENLTTVGNQNLIEKLNNVQEVQLSVANNVFISNKFAIKPSYKLLTETTFGSESQEVDFIQNVAAAKTINQWCEQKTHDRIKDLISPSDLNGGTAMVVTSAVYFKGKWQEQFDPQLTIDRPFHINKNTIKNVATMYKQGFFKYGPIPNVDASFIELPYKGGELSMLIILPDENDGLAKVESQLQQINYAELLRRSKQEVKLFMPRFKITSTLDLNQPLQEMGLTNIFTSQANLSGISDTDLFVSKAIQKAFIEVNEEGSEAAAATGLSIRPLSSLWVPPKPIELHVDRPFLAIIKYGNLVLFQTNVKS